MSTPLFGVSALVERGDLGCGDPGQDAGQRFEDGQAEPPDDGDPSRPAQPAPTTTSLAPGTKRCRMAVTSAGHRQPAGPAAGGEHGAGVRQPVSVGEDHVPGGPVDPSVEPVVQLRSARASLRKWPPCLIAATVGGLSRGGIRDTKSSQTPALRNCGHGRRRPRRP
ncbi:hypothetical protein [Streptomyces sp. ME18-1-4]|uniref:hypothetical protein n=1 Tax=Streptomyces sp. ME18-1-4 TaxID=3028685 RepID=UPI0029B8CBB6|nr:hypothetical protein [Streptomyces sp. ME18-1-4]MDX3246722.1 hypothetical protein [Streptomyces sp. ME18-1-4]